MKRAIIAAAGWKGSAADLGLGECPEAFLPLGNDMTILSRTAGILSGAGYKVYIAMAQKGYPYSRYIRWTSTKFLPRFPRNFPWDGSPWTQDKYDYASTLGEVLEMPDPGGWTTSLDTFCEAMDMLGEDAWDDLFLICGDMVIPRECFEYVLSCEPSFMFSFTAFHVCFGMDLCGACIFRELAEPYRRFKSEDSWLCDKDPSPSYQGIIDLVDNGFRHVQLDGGAPPCDWVDVDIDPTYQKARRIAREERLNGVA